MYCYRRTRCFMTPENHSSVGGYCTPLKAYFELHKRCTINHRSFAQLSTCRWRGTTCLVPGVAYSTAKWFKYIMFAFTTKKKILKIFSWWQNMSEIQAGKISPLPETQPGRSYFIGQLCIPVPVNPQSAPPTSFLNATWRQGIFSAMQAMKAT